MLLLQTICLPSPVLFLITKAFKDCSTHGFNAKPHFSWCSHLEHDYKMLKGDASSLEHRVHRLLPACQVSRGEINVDDKGEQQFYIPFIGLLIFSSPPLLLSTPSVYRPCGLDFINRHKSNLVLTKCSSESMRTVLSRLWLELCAQKNQEGLQGSLEVGHLPGIPEALVFGAE